MSRMKDMWGDEIEFLNGFLTGFGEDTVEVVFHGVEEGDIQSMVFDQKTARQFINKLLKAFEEDA